MKIFGLDIPIDLVKLYETYISVNRAGGLPPTSARTRRGAAKTISSRSATKIDQELRFAAEYIADLLKKPAGSAARRDFIAAELARLRDGQMTPEYWKQCTATDDQYYSCIPTCIEDINPPPYGYRNPLKKPSLVTYASGTPDAAPVRATGAIIAERWNDLTLIYRRTIYSLPKAVSIADLPPLIWTSNGTLTVAAAQRPSRPMLSLLMRAHIVAAGSAYDTDLSAPVQPATSFYWRFATPATPPPYYNATVEKRIQAMLNKRATLDVGANLSHVIIKSAARPMLGHGYNNNDTVETSYIGINKLWVAAKSPAATWGAHSAFFTVDADNITATAYPEAAPQGGIMRTNNTQSAGKFYWEITILTIDNPDFTRLRAGICTTADGLYGWLGATATSWARETTYDWDTSTLRTFKHHNLLSAYYGTNIAAGDIMSFALDLDAGTLITYINGVSDGVMYTGITGEISPAVGINNELEEWGETFFSVRANFGQSPMMYPAPEGYTEGWPGL